MKLKAIDEQVMVITGASSGIGLVTARSAVAAGARVVLAARSAEALRDLVEEFGDRAIHVPADVGRLGDVQRVADAALLAFGGFDTWVNNAGVSIYGRLDEIAIEDHRRLFETNYWGVVNGSLVAVRHLKQAGGALINVGSIASDRAVPLQGAYSASKHAIKGFTDALRMELEAERAPVSVSLIKPAPIDTPYAEHARSYLAVEGQNPPPLYAPELVARAILHCAQRPVRDVYVGGTARALATIGRLLPRATDRMMEKTMLRLQRSDRPRSDRADGLHHGVAELRERSGRHRPVVEKSVTTKIALHPVLGAIALLGAGLAVAGARRAALAKTSRRM